MDKWYKYSPICEEGQGSNCGKQQINFLGYENELVPQVGPVIWIIQEKVTSIEAWV